jgi:four helix bundle protein
MKGYKMKDNIIKEKSFNFAVRIVNLNKYLVSNKKEYVLSKQILRSGTSIGANVEEAIGGISKSDFSHKISIAYKESRETHFWLRLLYATEYIDKNMHDSLIADCDENCKILYSILKSSRIKKLKIATVVIAALIAHYSLLIIN